MESAEGLPPGGRPAYEETHGQMLEHSSLLLRDAVNLDGTLLQVLIDGTHVSRLVYPQRHASRRRLAQKLAETRPRLLKTCAPNRRLGALVEGQRRLQHLHPRHRVLKARGNGSKLRSVTENQGINLTLRRLETNLQSRIVTIRSAQCRHRHNHSLRPRKRPNTTK